MSKVAVELITNSKRVKGILSTVGRFAYDEFTGQSVHPQYHLVIDSLFVEILDDDVDRYIDVSEKYRKDPDLFKHCEKILEEEQQNKMEVSNALETGIHLD